MTRVAVLMGGLSAEREVSLSSGKACAKALRQAGFDVSEIDVTSDIAAVAKALSPKPDVAFNALHGRFGEDGCIQGLLELMAIPYTHSGVLASALAMDKTAAKTAFVSVGIRVPDGQVSTLENAHNVYPAPYVVKPVAEGSSVGVIIVPEGGNRSPIGQEWGFGVEALPVRG